MIENGIMEYAKWFIGFIIITTLVLLVILLFQLNQFNSFQQEVNYQIERHGGLTQEAVMALDKAAREDYGGCLALYDPDSDNRTCVNSTGEPQQFSGFRVAEIVEDGDKLASVADQRLGSAFITRSDDKQAHYGSTIEYVLERDVGFGKIPAFLQPIAKGQSSSRVRGDVS